MMYNVFFFFSHQTSTLSPHTSAHRQEMDLCLKSTDTKFCTLHFQTGFGLAYNYPSSQLFSTSCGAPLPLDFPRFAHEARLHRCLWAFFCAVVFAPLTVRKPDSARSHFGAYRLIIYQVSKNLPKRTTIYFSSQLNLNCRTFVSIFIVTSLAYFFSVIHRY